MKKLNKMPTEKNAVIEVIIEEKNESARPVEVSVMMLEIKDMVNAIEMRELSGNLYIKGFEMDYDTVTRSGGIEHGWNVSGDWVFYQINKGFDYRSYPVFGGSDY